MCEGMQYKCVCSLRHYRALILYSHCWDSPKVPRRSFYFRVFWFVFMVENKVIFGLKLK